MNINDMQIKIIYLANSLEYLPFLTDHLLRLGLFLDIIMLCLFAYTTVIGLNLLCVFCDITK